MARPDRVRRGRHRRVGLTRRVSRTWALPAWTASLTAVELAQLAHPGHLLVRDAVSTPRTFPTASALGLGDAPPRAVPQEWLLVILTTVVDGGVVVRVLLAASLIAAGIGFGRLAAAVVPRARLAGTLAAATVGIWNPFVAERLSQGHWSLLASLAALPWLTLAALRLCADRRATPTPVVSIGLWSAVAGLTPTGSLLAAAVLLAFLPRALRRTTTPGGGTRHRRILGAAVLWLATAAPWLTAAALGGGATTASARSAELFAGRAEPGLGTLGSLAGLGGIWNADAVPGSRTTPWAAVATAVLLTVVAAGGVALGRAAGGRPGLRGRVGPSVPGRTELGRGRPLRPVWALAAAGILLPALAATAPGLVVAGWAVETIPGAALFRDTQKWVALAVPAYAITAAAATGAIAARLGRGRVARNGRVVRLAAGATIVTAVIAPLPDLVALDALRPVAYPPGWVATAGSVRGPGDALLLPAGQIRRYSFAHAPAVDPLPRLLRVDTLTDTALRVDGVLVDDAPDSRAARARRAAAAPDGAVALAALGVGWVVVEGEPPPLPAGLEIASATSGLTVYAVPGPITGHTPDAARRAAAIAAHLAWIAVGLGCAASALRTRRRKLR